MIKDVVDSGHSEHPQVASACARTCKPCSILSPSLSFVAHLGHVLTWERTKLTCAKCDINLTPITTGKHHRLSSKLTKPVVKLLLKTPQSLLELSVEKLAAKSAKNGETPSCTVRGACSGTLKGLAVAEESTEERYCGITSFRSWWVLGYPWHVCTYSVQVVHPLAMPMIPYIMRPNSTRMSPPHVSPSSISDSSSLEAVTHPPCAVIVEVW